MRGILGGRVRHHSHWLVLLLSLLVACSGDGAPTDTAADRQELYAYKNSGLYLAEIKGATEAAELYLAHHVDKAAKQAVVFDIDETALSNWLFLKANQLSLVFDGPCNLPHGPCGYYAWIELEEATAIGPTLRLFQTARDLGYAIFMISGRPEMSRAATERNLRAVGYDTWTAIYLEPAGTHYATTADFKVPLRQEIEAAGYEIVVNIGDQESDLAGGYAKSRFKLPNPFYLIP